MLLISVEEMDKFRRKAHVDPNESDESLLFRLENAFRRHVMPGDEQSSFPFFDVKMKAQASWADGKLIRAEVRVA